MKKSEKVNWENLDKNGMVLTGFSISNNEVQRRIMNQYDMQCAMLYVVLVSHRNSQSGACFPSIEVLARECGVSTRSIKGYIAKLHKGGYILIDSGRNGVSSNYFFPMESFYKGEGALATRRRKGNFDTKNG